MEAEHLEYLEWRFLETPMIFKMCDIQLGAALYII